MEVATLDMTHEDIALVRGAAAVGRAWCERRLRELFPDRYMPPGWDILTKRNGAY